MKATESTERKRTRAPCSLVGVTGTPGTGKKTISPLVARDLGRRWTDLNSLARKLHRRRPSQARSASRGTILVDVERLRKSALNEDLADSVVSGHLLPEVFRTADVSFVAVLRCNPTVLKARLIQRGYPGSKVRENVEAELIGVVLDASVSAFGSSLVHEYDTTDAAPPSIARKIVDDYRSGRKGGRRWIDWTYDYDSPTKLRLLLSGAKAGPASI